MRRLRGLFCTLQTVAFGSQWDLHAGKPWAVCPLCVYPLSKNVFRLGAAGIFSPPSESCSRVVFLHSDSSPRCCLQRLPIDSLMPSLRAAAPFPSLTARPTPFNLRAASNAFLPLFSNYRRHVSCMKRQIKDLNNLPKPSVSVFDWPTVTCSVILLL